MRKLLVILILVLGVTSMASAVGVTTNWKITGTPDWFTAANWTNGVPTNETGNSTTLYASTTQANGPTISTTGATALAVRLGGSGGPSGTTAHLTVASGGYLTVGDFLLVAPDSTTGGGRNGYLHVTGGTIDLLTGQGKLGIGNGADSNALGSQNITGTMEMTAGVINARMMMIGANLTKGIVNMSGGTINTLDFVMRPNASNLNTPVLNLSGTGQIIINGNLAARIQGYKDNLWINDEVQISTALNPGKTTLYIVPEPATICLLGIGALSLLRRKK